MFERITLRGGAATVLWGYRTAAAVRAWRIRKQPEGQWVLTATLEHGDAFQLRQRPLLFTAPREGGFMVWPVVDVQLDNNQLRARLGPPEQ